MGHISPRKLYEGNLKKGLLYWGPRRICQIRLWKWASVSIGAPFLGNMEGRSSPRVFEEKGKFIYGNFMWNLRYVKGLWWKAGGCSFSGNSERK